MSENDAQDQTQPVRPAGATSGPPGASRPAAPPPAATSIPTAPPVAEPETVPAAAAPEPAPAARRGFRERFRAARRSDGSRAYSLGALIASALAGVIVGGLGYAAIDALAGDDHGPGRGGCVQRDDDRGPGGRGGMHGGPPGVPGQLPPTTAPDDDEGSSS